MMMSETHHDETSGNSPSSVTPAARATLAFVLGLAVLCAASLPTTLGAQSDPTTPPPCRDEVYRQFDFWLGQWNVLEADGTAAGTNHIEAILNGCVLLESWSGVGGSIGKSFNQYDRSERVWRQTWVDGGGGRLDLAGGLEGQRMVLRGQGRDREGKPLLHEVAWTPRDDGTVEQHWRSSADGGTTWSDVFLGIYTKATADKS